MDDLSCAIDEIAVDLTIVRHYPPTVVKGRVQSAPIEKLIKTRGSFQPSKQKELQLLPEGMRNGGAMTLFLGGGQDLVTVDTSACKIPDRILYRGATYQVMTVDDWRDTAGYVMAICVRTGQ